MVLGAARHSHRIDLHECTYSIKSNKQQPWAKPSVPWWKPVASRSPSYLAAIIRPRAWKDGVHFGGLRLRHAKTEEEEEESSVMPVTRSETVPQQKIVFTTNRKGFCTPPSTPPAMPRSAIRHLGPASRSRGSFTVLPSKVSGYLSSLRGCFNIAGPHFHYESVVDSLKSTPHPFALRSC